MSSLILTFSPKGEKEKRASTVDDWHPCDMSHRVNNDPAANSRQRLPAWLQKRGVLHGHVHAMKRQLRDRALHTVCEEARCPNIGECFSRGTATIMIMGDTCTRRCRFCAVAHGTPAPLDPDEPGRVARQIKAMGLTHAVITSVTRDDLPDGGAGHFAATIREIRRRCPQTTIEVLTPDFEGRGGDVATVCAAGPDVFNHNVETVLRLTPRVRDRADYRRSLRVLEMARQTLPFVRGGKGGEDQGLPPPTPPYKGGGLVKSGLMVGLGERSAEVEATLADLKAAGCDIVTIGQYLPPSRDAIPVAEYLSPERFWEYEAMGKRCGIATVFAGPLVRSSYLADKVMVEDHPSP